MAEPTYDELKARLEELEKKGVRRTGELDFKVGEKGGVSVYGLGRFPVTLYYEQWNRLLEAAPKLREFLEENKSRLKAEGKIITPAHVPASPEKTGQPPHRSNQLSVALCHSQCPLC